MKRPKAPEPTAQEMAGVERQSRMLDEETEEMERRLKAAARGKGGGTPSLLAKGGASKSGGISRRSMVGGNYGGTGGGRAGSANGGSGYSGTPSTPRPGSTKTR